LEEHADAVETFMTSPQALEANEQIAARLTKLEQRLKAVTDELSLVEQTIDGATVRDRDRNDSIEAMNSRLMNTQKRVDELFPRLELGERARIDLGTLIGLFVKQLKRVNLNSAETALRVADLESLRSKVTGLEERVTSALFGKDYGSTEDSAGDINDIVTDTTPKTGDDAGSFEASNGSGNAGVAEESPTSTEEASNEPSLEGEGVSGSRPETGVTNELHEA
jgi:hypothetical protein